MIPRFLWKPIAGAIAFFVVLIGGGANGADPNLTLVVAAAAGFGTIIVSWKLGG